MLFTVPPIGPIDEIQTRLAERLVAAFTDANLIDNPDGIAKVLSDAAKETDDILKREGLLGNP